MAYSSITLTFNAVPDINDFINIRETATGLNLNELFVEERLNSNEVSIPLFEPEDGLRPERYFGFISTNYKNAFNADYNSEGLFTVTSTNDDVNSGTGTVTIMATFENAVFEVVSNFAPVTTSITNETVVVPPAANSVTPLSLVFARIINIPDTSSKNSVITTEAAWNIATVLPAWLHLSQKNGTGNTTITATIIDYDTLDVGEFTTTFNVAIESDVFTVSVVLTISSFVAVPFLPGNLYFTEELEYLKFASLSPGTYVKIDIEIMVFKINTNEAIIYNRTYNFPFFQRKGNFHVGNIVHGLLEEIEKLSDFVPNFDSNYYKNQMRPAEIAISFQEKSFGAILPGLVSGSIPMFKMNKGHKPFMTTGQLALLTVAQQDIIRITPQSHIGTSFVYFGTPRIIVKKNNVVIEDFEIVPKPNEVIYSYYRFINNMKPGDSIDLIVVNGLETRSQRFLVFMNGLENTYFLFENKNGVIEPYEMSGRRRVLSNIKQTTTPKFKELHPYNEKVKAEITQSLIVNTGNLGKADHIVLNALICSTNVWCAIDDPLGPYLKVDATTAKLTNQDTSSSDEGFDIEFNLLENANASIYPR
jgi:hypothetical protein